MGKYKRKTGQKVVFIQEKMEEVKRRHTSSESQQQVSKSLGTNECTLRKWLKAIKYHIYLNARRLSSDPPEKNVCQGTKYLSKSKINPQNKTK